MSARAFGRDVSLDEAIAAGAALLTRARLPLVYGLVESTVEAQREAVALARRLAGALDTAASAAHAGALAAFQAAGALTTSLGEMRRRADLVLFWGLDPDGVEPGFVARYAPPRAGRVRIAVDVGPAAGPPGVEERLRIPPEREVECLLALRAFLRGRRVEPAAAAPLGLPLDALRGLARRLSASAYGIIVSDGEPPSERRDPLCAVTLNALPRQARERSRLRSLLVRRGNSVGADNVLTWLTGFPAAIRFGPDGARFDPSGSSAEALLASRRADAALVVGALPERYLSAQALASLNALPTVRVGGTPAGQVFISTAPSDETTGHVFRMDGVPLHRQGRAGSLPSEADVLARLCLAVGQATERA